MIIKYRLPLEKSYPEKKIFTLAGILDKEGFEIRTAELKAITKGHIRYKKGIVYKLCPICFEFLEISDFGSYPVRAFKVNEYCKRCRSSISRRKNYGIVDKISDVAFKNEAYDFILSLSERNQTILRNKLGGGKDENN